MGGLALLGVGAVAGLIGIASLVGGGGGGESAAAAGPTPTSAAAPAAPSTPSAIPPPAAAGSTPAPGGVAVPSFNPAPNGLTAPSNNAAAAPTARAVAKIPVRVYNNSKITGLAERAAEDLRAQGWPVDAVANYSQGVIPTSTVYYRQGTAEESSAQALGRAFGVRVEPRFAGLTDASPGLILIVTNDYGA